MNSESSYFKLGLFVIMGVLLLVGGVVLFGAGAFFTEYVRMETSTTETVQGLDVGSAIKYQGVTVGKVAHIEMAIWRYRSADPTREKGVDRYIVIDMDIRHDMIPERGREQIKQNLAASIERGMRVRISSSGLTGPSYLEILFDPKKPPVPALPYTPDNLYIPSAPGTMSQIVSGVDAIIEELRKAQISKLVADLDRLVNNTDKAVVDIKTEVLRDKVAAVLDEARQTVERVHEILRNPNIDRTINDVSATAGSVKDIASGEQVKAVVADLPKISARLRDTTERIDAIVHDAKVQKMIDGLSDTASQTGPAAVELRRSLRELSTLLSSERQDLEAIVVGLRKIAEGGAAVVEDARSNPSRVLFGEPPPHLENGAKKK
jgi:ABC-type transporter Mla subunit MlaD